MRHISSFSIYTIIVLLNISFSSNANDDNWISLTIDKVCSFEMNGVAIKQGEIFGRKTDVRSFLSGSKNFIMNINQCGLVFLDLSMDYPKIKQRKMQEIEYVIDKFSVQFRPNNISSNTIRLIDFSRLAPEVWSKLRIASNLPPPNGLPPSPSDSSGKHVGYTTQICMDEGDIITVCYIAKEHSQCYKRNGKSSKHDYQILHSFESCEDEQLTVRLEPAY